MQGVVNASLCDFADIWVFGCLCCSFSTFFLLVYCALLSMPSALPIAPFFPLAPSFSYPTIFMFLKRPTAVLKLFLKAATCL